MKIWSKIIVAGIFLAAAWFMIKGTQDLTKQLLIGGFFLFLIFFKTMASQSFRSAVILIIFGAIMIFAVKYANDFAIHDPLYLVYGAIVALIANLLCIKFIFQKDEKAKKQATLKKDSLLATASSNPYLGIPILLFLLYLEVMLFAFDIYNFLTRGGGPLVIPELILVILSSSLLLAQYEEFRQKQH